jgi:hypothetical protein
VKLVHNGGGNTEHLSVSSVRYISLIIEQDGIEKRGNHAFVDHREIISLLYVDVDKLQDLLLDGAKTSDFGCLGLDIAYTM